VRKSQASFLPCCELYSARARASGSALHRECIGTSLRSHRGFFFSAILLSLSLSLSRIFAFHSFLSGRRKVLTAIRDGIVAQSRAFCRSPWRSIFQIGESASKTEGISSSPPPRHILLHFPFFSRFLLFFLFFFFFFFFFFSSEISLVIPRGERNKGTRVVALLA